jgi:hypothetical protein
VRCLITNGHMSCGSRFPPKRKRSFPILAVRPTLKLAAALVRQAAIPLQGIGALSRRRSLAGRADAHPRSTPYSVEQADPDPRPRRDVGIKRGTAFWRIGHSGRHPDLMFLRAFSPAGARALSPRVGIRAGRLAVRSLNVARPAGAQPVRRINLYVKLTAPHSKRKFLARMLVLQQAF